MSNADRLFRNTVFGGFNKDDVIDYIENMKNEFFEYRSQVEQTIKELNEKITSLQEEALTAKKEAAEIVASSQAAVAAAEEKAAEAETKSAELAAKTEPDAAEEINSAADKLRRVADELCDSLTGFLDRISKSSIAVTVEQPQQASVSSKEESSAVEPTMTKEREADILSFIDRILKSSSETESIKKEPQKADEPSLLDSLLPDKLFK